MSEAISCELSGLKASIEANVKRIREIAVDPVSIQLWGRIDIEVRPKSDDDRILVGCASRGFTTVNYTDEGVIVDVIPDDGLEPVGSLCVFEDELMAQEAADA